MKSIVLDGDKLAEAIQKAKDKMINGEYDNNDLILRGDALKAIRQRCICEHLPFDSNTPVGARVLDALAAVYQVKPYKDVCGKDESQTKMLHSARIRHLAEILKNEYSDRTVTIDNLIYILNKLADIIAEDETPKEEP